MANLIPIKQITGINEILINGLSGSVDLMNASAIIAKFSGSVYSPFISLTAQPMDSRFVVETLTALTILNDSYNGLQVYVTDQSSSYIQTPAGAWQKVVVSGSDASLSTLSVDTVVTAASFTGSTDFNTLVNKPTLVSGSGQVDVRSTIAYATLTTTASFNSYTSSVDSRLNSIEISTGSLDGRLDSIETVSASLLIRTNALETTSTSLLSFTASADLRVDGLETKSGSWDTAYNWGNHVDGGYAMSASFNSYTLSADSRLNGLAAYTSSYATTGSNNFKNSQQITGSLNVSTTVTAVNFTGSTDFATLVGKPTLISGSEQVDVRSTIAYATLTTTASFTAYTSSADNRLNSIETVTASLLIRTNALEETSASLLSFTASADIRLDLLEIASGSLGNRIFGIETKSGSWDTAYNWGDHVDGGYATSASFNSYTSSADSRLNSIEITTSSFGGRLDSIETVSASLLSFTASADIRISGLETKSGSWDTAYNWGDHGIAGYAMSASFNSYTSSADSRLDSIELATGSLDSRLNSIETVSASLLIRTSALEATSASLLSFTASADLRITGLEEKSGSWDTAYNWGNHVDGGYAMSASFNSYTLSADSRLDSIETVSASLLSFTASADLRMTGLEDKSGSWDTAYNWGDHSTVGYLIGSSTASIDGRLNAIETVTASQNGRLNSLEATSASIDNRLDAVELVTASADLRITGLEDKSGSWDEAYGWNNHATAGYAMSASFNSYTSSADSRLNSIEIATSSLDARLDSVETVTASLSLQVASLEVVSASLKSFTASVDLRVNGMETKSGSWDEAHGWGNHANAGYAISSSVSATFVEKVAGSSLITTEQVNKVNASATTGSNTFNGGQTINGPLNIFGNIYQSGSAYETHAEQVYSTKNYIYLRSGSNAGLGTGEYTGIESVKYDGTNNGRLVFDKDGIARVGDIGSEQPLSTREETPTDKAVAVWNSTSSKFETTSSLTYDGTDLKVGNQPVLLAETLFNASVAKNITVEQTGSWDIANSWGNHSLGGYENAASASIQYNTFNDYTASADNKFNSIEITTGSFDSRIDSIETVSASLLIRTSALEATSASLLSFTASADLRVDGLETKSGSWDTAYNWGNHVDGGYAMSASFNSYTLSADSRLDSIESYTSSYATTGSNNFKNSQQITGSLNVSTTVTAVNFTGSTDFATLVDKPALVSGSGQISFTGIADKPTLISGSGQVDFGSITGKPTLVSGSSQIDLTGITNYGIVTSLVAATSSYYHTGNSNLSTVDWAAKGLTANALNIINSTSQVASKTIGINNTLTQTVGGSGHQTIGTFNSATYSGSGNETVVFGIKNYNYLNTTGTVTATYGDQSILYNNGAVLTSGEGVEGSVKNNSGTLTSGYGVVGNVEIIGGKFNKITGVYSNVDNASSDVTNNDVYGFYSGFHNSGVFDGYAGLQIDAYNTGTARILTGLQVDFYTAGGTTQELRGIDIGVTHPWTGTPTNSYGIYIDASTNIGTSTNYAIYSTSTANSYFAGNVDVVGGITGSANFDTLANKPSLVSGSSQIDITQTTNYSVISTQIGNINTILESIIG